METDIVAVERVNYYAQLPVEALPSDLDDPLPRKDNENEYINQSVSTCIRDSFLICYCICCFLID